MFISAIFNSDWSLASLQISSIDILEEEDFNKLRDKIIDDIKEDIAKDVVKFDYKEKQISEYLSARIRKQILKATDIKPVVFMHFYKAQSE